MNLMNNIMFRSSSLSPGALRQVGNVAPEGAMLPTWRGAPRESEENQKKKKLIGQESTEALLTVCEKTDQSNNIASRAISCGITIAFSIFPIPLLQASNECRIYCKEITQKTPEC